MSYTLDVTAMLKKIVILLFNNTIKTIIHGVLILTFNSLDPHLKGLHSDKI